jgi:hypothetical protein
MLLTEGTEKSNAPVLLGVTEFGSGLAPGIDPCCPGDNHVDGFVSDAPAGGDVLPNGLKACNMVSLNSLHLGEL